MIQCKFEHDNQYQYAWIDYDLHLGLGSVVSFKKDERKWKIVEVGHIVQSIKEIETTWLVGGNQEITARKEIA